MTEPEFPYEKKPKEPLRDMIAPPLPGQPPSPPPVSYPSPKFTCQTSGKVFTTKEELTMHLETVHRSPKNKSKA